MKKENKNNIKKIILTALFMLIFITLLKFLPIKDYGKNIQFDASLHLTITIFIIYSLWLFFKNERNSKLFFILAIIAVALVSLQRILVQAHNAFGLLSAFLLSIISIILAESLVK